MGEPYFGVYFESDDTPVSVAPETEDAVSFTLDAAEEEKDKEQLYAEADEGYYIEDFLVEPDGDNASKWRLSDKSDPDPENDDDWEDWGASLSLGTVEHGSEGRVHFWAQARVSETEDPIKDTSVTFECSGMAKAS